MLSCPLITARGERVPFLSSLTCPTHSRKFMNLCISIPHPFYILTCSPLPDVSGDSTPSLSEQGDTAGGLRLSAGKTWTLDQWETTPWSSLKMTMTRPSLPGLPGSTSWRSLCPHRYHACPSALTLIERLHIYKIFQSHTSSPLHLPLRHLSVAVTRAKQTSLRSGAGSGGRFGNRQLQTIDIIWD